MRIRWRNFELPSQVRLDRETATPQYGKFVVEPFEKGFGTTIGNGLRRVLLSSIEGTAVTWVKIDGVVHEFSTIPGVLEDVTQIILNIKKLRVKMHTDAPTTLRIDVNKRGEVKAEAIEGDHNIEIANPELKICTLTDDVRFLCEMQVKKGRNGKPITIQNTGLSDYVQYVSVTNTHRSDTLQFAYSGTSAATWQLEAKSK